MTGNADALRMVVECARPHLDQTRGPRSIGLPQSTGPGCLSSHPYKRHATAKTPAPSEEVESMYNQLFSWRSITRLALFLLPATLTASAQTAARDHPSTDAEKIADALRAGHASSRSFLFNDTATLEIYTLSLHDATRCAAGS